MVMPITVAMTPTPKMANRIAQMISPSDAWGQETQGETTTIGVSWEHLNFKLDDAETLNTYPAFGWHCWVAPLCGTFVWHLWVAPLGGTIGWHRWVAPLGGTVGWHHWVTPLGGTNPAEILKKFKRSYSPNIFPF